MLILGKFPTKLNQMISSLVSLIFPNICFACGDTLANQQKHICTSCFLSMPRTNFFGSEKNEVEQKFWGRVELQRATSFLYFTNKGKVQQIIHHFKYKGQKEIGVTLGEWAAAELLTQGFFESIDLIIPIPIHELKKQKRGYNQSDFIAAGLGNLTGIEIETKNLVKQLNTQSQTRKSRFKRWENVKTTFKVRDEQKLTGKHILLVDDVITTGATVEACAIELLKVQNVKLSLLSIAMTY